MDIDTCPKCQSTNLIRQTGADEPSSKYGRLKCGDCGKFIIWLKDPSVTLHQLNRATAINTILAEHDNKLSDWGREFLVSVREQRVLSEKQQIQLNNIGMRCLGVRICASDSVPPTGKKQPTRSWGVGNDC
jgi:hypothetical protein